jgi:hypothetical protein
LCENNKRALKTRKSDQGRNEVWALNKKGKEGDQETNKEVYKFWTMSKTFS